MASDLADGPRISKRAVTLPPSCAEVVDVLFDDVRIFSISPDAGATTEGDGRRVEWPSALKGHLRGSTTVTLRSHLGGELLAREDVAFSAHPDRVHVVDEEGHPLIMNKWGHLERPLAADSADTVLMLDSATELIDICRELSLDVFIAYGSLLGAVRDGHVIGHDTDVDVAYYSKWDHPADIMRESFAVERRLAELGWKVTRRSGACMQVRQVIDGVLGPRVDLFACYHVNGWFALEKAVRGRLPREALLPLGEVELEGRRFPAPRDPAALLAVTYGESWAVPDPAFTYQFPPAVRGRTGGWFGMRHDRVHWRNATRKTMREHREESSFARHVDGTLAGTTTVVDVGCGTGADAVWLARDGRKVVGLDFVPDALRRARRRAKDTASARFENLNLHDLRAVLTTSAQLALAEPDVALYAHHLLDSVRPSGRANLWLFAKVLLGGGGTLFLQFHTRLAADGSVQRVPAPLLGGVDPDEVVAEVAERGGRVTSREELELDGRWVCRLAVTFAANREE